MGLIVDVGALTKGIALLNLLLFLDNGRFEPDNYAVGRTIFALLLSRQN